MLKKRKHFFLYFLLIIHLHYCQANREKTIQNEAPEEEKRKRSQEKLYKYRLYGDLDEYAYYFLDIDVGIPEQRISVILDTGSSTLSFPCSECKSCGIHMEKPFNLNFSKTSTVLYCKKKNCPYNLKCVDGKCEYLQSYCEGSQIKGFYFIDVISLMSYNQKEKIMFKKLIGCHMHEESLFLYQQATGVLGMSVTKPKGVPTVIDLLFYFNPEIEKKFSICISDEGGELIIGGYEDAYLLNGGRNGIVHLRPESWTHTHSDTNETHTNANATATNAGDVTTGKEQNEENSMEETKEEWEEEWGKKKGKKGKKENEETKYIDITKNEDGPEYEHMFEHEDDEDTCPKEEICRSNNKKKKDTIVWTNITRRFHYYVKVHSFEIFDKNLMEENPPMEVLLDSGSTFAHIPEYIYNGLDSFFNILCIRDINNMFEINQSIKIVEDLIKKNVHYAMDLKNSLKNIIENKNTCVEIIDGIQCWKYVDGLPSIYITIDKWKIEWKPSAYLYKKESYWCKGFEIETNNKTIFGLTFFKHKQIIFDLKHYQIGIVDSICPSYPFHVRPRTYNEYNEKDSLFLNIPFFNLYGLIILVALSLFLSIIFYVKKLYLMNLFVTTDMQRAALKDQQCISKPILQDDTIH